MEKNRFYKYLLYIIVPIYSWMWISMAITSLTIAPIIIFTVIWLPILLILYRVIKKKEE